MEHEAYFYRRNGSNLRGGIRMSEKVKLTREQAEAVEIRRNMNMFENSIKCHITGQFKGDSNKALAELSLDEFIRALYIGYEVEESYEVGDCVVLDDGQIVEIIEDGSCTVVVGWIINRLMYRDQINKSLIKRHATKQERWWAKHGRNVWELKENDILYYDDE